MPIIWPGPNELGELMQPLFVAILIHPVRYSPLETRL